MSIIIKIKRDNFIYIYIILCKYINSNIQIIEDVFKLIIFTQ